MYYVNQGLYCNLLDSNGYMFSILELDITMVLLPVLPKPSIKSTYVPTEVGKGYIIKNGLYFIAKMVSIYYG